MPEPFVQLSHVSKAYHDVPAVDNLDLDINRGEIVGIIGHEGAGKTTVVNLIAGLIPPSSGKLTIMGKDIQEGGLSMWKLVGYMPKGNALCDGMCAQDFLTFFAQAHGMSPAESIEQASRVLESLNIDSGKIYIGDMSTGMKRKMDIARTVMHDPDLVVMDEPDSGIDPLTWFFIIDYLKKLRDKGKTIVFSSHNLFHVEYVCDRVAIIKQGRFVVCDTMDNIRKTLGKHDYEIEFQAPAGLDYPQKNGNYLVKTSDIEEMAALLKKISDHHWDMVDLTIEQPAIEDI